MYIKHYITLFAILRTYFLDTIQIYPCERVLKYVHVRHTSWFREPVVKFDVVVSFRYKCTEEIITISAMLSVNNAVFYRPKVTKLAQQWFS